MATTHLVQIIEDEPFHVTLLDRVLRQAHFDTAIAVDGLSGWNEVQHLLPSLILLDLMLPGMSGHEVCRLVRGTPSTRHIPIIMLTAVGTDEDRIAGLDMGADDYVTKPFSPREVVSRVQTVLRRTYSPQTWPEPFSDHAIKVESAFFVVSLRQRQISVSDWELKLLRRMLNREGDILQSDDLIPLTGATQESISLEEFELRVRSLRRKLENGDAGSIEILPGGRYRFRTHPRTV